MVGDTDPPKCSVYGGFHLENSRTCSVERKGEFSAAPSPAAHFQAETKIPAAAGTEAGTNSKRLAISQYRTALSFARYRVSSCLLVEVLA